MKLSLMTFASVATLKIMHVIADGCDTLISIANYHLAHDSIELVNWLMKYFA